MITIYILEHFDNNSITLDILENFEKIDYTKYFEKFEEKMITLYIFENFD